MICRMASRASSRSCGVLESQKTFSSDGSDAAVTEKAPLSSLMSPAISMAPLYKMPESADSMSRRAYSGSWPGWMTSASRSGTVTQAG